MKLLTLFLSVQLSYGFIPFTTTISDTLPESFNWSDVQPLNKLRYTPCYEGFECARYTVPLDWTDLSNDNEVVIAVIRLPATVPESHPSFGGTIVLNPGGPGGSGVDFVRWAGRGVQEIVDGDKHFEILSFDPRGIKYTTPSTACYEDDAHRNLYLLQNTDVGSVDDSAFSLNKKWALAQGLGQLCDISNLGVYPDGTNIRQYVSTALVAHDMVSLTDAIEEQLSHALSTSHSGSSNQRVLEEKHDLPLLNYWGYSYGSYLGNTYASMFPGRVGRMILDGVVDAPDYAATGWSTNLNDNDKVWQKFFEWCFEAGPKCALCSPDIKSPDDMATQVYHFMDYLKENPISIIYNDTIVVFTYFDLETIFHASSYGPHQMWPWLAITLFNFVQTDPTALTTLPIIPIRSLPLPLPFLSPFNNHSTAYPTGYSHGLEASASILCGDGTPIPANKTSFHTYLTDLKTQSPLIGPIWAQITLWCRHWPSSQRPSPKNVFSGPFTSNLSQYAKGGSPLLFIGNTADPVTPVRNAVAMASGHEGARVLVQDSPGHCSGVNIPSECTWGAVREFFNKGELPKNGTVCGVDWKPWD